MVQTIEREARGTRGQRKRLPTLQGTERPGIAALGKLKQKGLLVEMRLRRD